MTSTDIGIMCEFKMGFGTSRAYTYLSDTTYPSGSLVVVPSRGKFRIVRVCGIQNPFVPLPGIEYKRVVCAASGFPFQAPLIGKAAYYGVLVRQSPQKEHVNYQSAAPLIAGQTVLFSASAFVAIGQILNCKVGTVPAENEARIRKILE